MVQVVENKTDLSGEIESRRPHPTLPDYDLLNVRVDTAKPIEGFPNLLSQHEGKTVELLVKRNLLPQGDLANRKARTTASVAGPGVVRAGDDVSVQA
jgi:hypothetical protein